MWSDNPIRDAESYYSSQESELESLPECAECGCKIQQETALKIGGDFYCDECIEKLRVAIDF